MPCNILHEQNSIKVYGTQDADVFCMVQRQNSSREMHGYFRCLVLGNHFKQINLQAFYHCTVYNTVHAPNTINIKFVNLVTNTAPQTTMNFS